MQRRRATNGEPVDELNEKGLLLVLCVMPYLTVATAECASVNPAIQNYIEVLQEGSCSLPAKVSHDMYKIHTVSI